MCHENTYKEGIPSHHERSIFALIPQLRVRLINAEGPIVPTFSRLAVGRQPHAASAIAAAISLFTR